MRFTKEERADIAKKIVEGQLTYKEAKETFNVSDSLLRQYVHRYKVSIGLVDSNKTKNFEQISISVNKQDYSSLEKLTKEELIDEVIKAKIGEARAKKGYTVKGGGRKKEFVPLNKENSK